MSDYKLPIITGTSLNVGDLLRWDGSNWVNYPDSSYWAAALLSDCVGHWKLNDNAADTVVVDSSGNGHHGIASANTDTFNDTGKINGSLNMDPAYVVISNHADLSFTGDSPFSISAWIYVTSFGSWQTILAKASTYNVGEWTLLLDAFEAISFSCIDIDDNRISIIGNILAGGWHHVVLTYDGSNLRTGLSLYIDGVLDYFRVDGDPGYSGMTAGGLDVFIGSESGESHKFQDKLDNVILFNKELSAGEVNYLWNSGRGIEALIIGTDDSPTFENTDVTGIYKVDGVQVVSNQGAVVADATDAATTMARLNELLARCRTHGLIAT